MAWRGRKEPTAAGEGSGGAPEPPGVSRSATSPFFLAPFPPQDPLAAVNDRSQTHGGEDRPRSDVRGPGSVHVGQSSDQEARGAE